MKRIRYFKYLAIIVFLSSCYIAHKSEKRAFGCYKENYPSIDSLVETNGYFEINYYFPLESEKRKFPRTEFGLILYKDGTCVTASKEFLLNIIDSVKIWGGLTSGTYTISNDTILIKFLTIGSTTSTCWIEKFKILSPRRLRQVYAGSWEYGEYTKTHTFVEAKFVPYNVSSINDELWVKKQSWFWCDKNEYKAWKKRIKK